MNRPDYASLSELDSFHYDEREACLLARSGRMEVSVQVLAEDLFRVRMTPAGRARLLETETATFPFPAVSKTKWPPPAATLSETGDALRLTTTTASVEVSRAPLRLAFFDASGELLNRDSPELGMGWRRRSVVCAKELLDGEHFYGFGEHMGFLDRRGTRMTMWNTDVCPHMPVTDPMYKSVPFFISLRRGRAYGIFFANSHRSYFDMGKERADRYFFGADGGEMDYYFFAGPDPKAILARYTELTGRMELPPLWALGYHQSRYSYASADEVRRVAGEFRRRGIPCDAIYLDIDYMDGYRVFTWDKRRFPEPKKLVDELASEGFRVVTIVDPGVKVDPDYEVYRQGSQRGYFCVRPDGSEFHGKVWPGETAFPDFVRADVRRWWGECHRTLLEAGVAGIWNDMNEPSVFDGPGKTMPGEVLHGEEGRGEANAGEANHSAIHNLYGLLMCQATHEALRKARPDKRPFILTRAGFAGIQRYAAVWTGDNSSWWEHLAASMPMCLNLGMSGIPFAGVDVGGFLGDAEGELFVRWVQLGCFLPFFRNHAEVWARAQEPWAFGAQYEKIAREYIRLRYRFLPYLYNVFREAALTGLPVIRPLALEFPGDEAGLRVWDEFLVGGDLLVAPVYLPAATHRAVYLPEGEWVHYRTKTHYRGPAHILVEAPLTELPLFVRAGAIIPNGPELNFTGERPVDPLVLDIYPAQAPAGGMVRRSYYEDDGVSLSYNTGGFAITEFTCETRNDGREIEFRVGEKTGTYAAGRSSYLLCFNVRSTDKYDVRLDGIALPLVPRSVGREAAAGQAMWWCENATVCVGIPDNGGAAMVSLRLLP